MSDNTPVGLAAFDSLHAEHEPWLPQAFVKPFDDLHYAKVIGEQSVVVFGETGSGKTTLREALRWHSTGADGYPSRLIVNWNPRLMLEGTPQPAELTVADQLSHLFDENAMAVAYHLEQYPDRWESLPTWAQDSLIWFVQRHLKGDRDARLRLLKERSTPLAGRILDMLVSRTVRPTLYDDAPHEQITAELVKALQPFGLQGIWIIADELDRYLDFREQLVCVLQKFLSALGIFERPRQIAYKLFLPAQLQFDLMKNATIQQCRRFETVSLTWSMPQIQAMVDRRLALASGQANMTLSDLCQDHNLLGWLERACGSNPREWLSQVRPLVDRYLAQGGRQPLDAETCIKLRRQYPPRLFINTATRRIFVGNREIPLEDLPDKGFDVLCYLYEHAERTVSKAELYYCAYLKLPAVPRGPDDTHYVLPHAYADLMNTLIYRVRVAIEPDYSEPVLITTVRGQGLRLNIRW